MVLILGDARETTASIPKTLNPEWNSTFEFSITGVEGLVLEGVCWDKDRFRKDYMGELDIPLEEVFTGPDRLMAEVYRLSLVENYIGS